jgi:LmbE family N-acetylglucosaminyl deacetylase
MAAVRGIARVRGIAALALSIGAASSAGAQQPPAQLDAAAILHRIHGLEVTGSVLYIAAHPDDENTRLISYLSNGRQVRTGYLSLTRGDGGQNLIGPELGDALGILRTQELLQARRIDGGEQFFTRAVDFGYSKSAEETFAKWGRQEVLADVVRVLRTFRPDVIVTRFDTDGSGGHGHHTASAILAHEAFDRAADPNAFPEQLAQGLEPWRTKHLFFNASTWWKKDLPAVAAEDPKRWVGVDVGGFDPLLGTSYTEIAGRSRSQHKSQGFGAAETRGEQIEYLRMDKGPELESSDLFDGVELGWDRIEGGASILPLLRAVSDGFDPRAPEKSVPGLSELARRLDELSAADLAGRDQVLRKAEIVRQLILQCCGAVVEATSGVQRAAAGDTLLVRLAAMQRRPGALLDIQGYSGPTSAEVSVRQALPWNRALEQELHFAVQSDLPIDQPYWLAAPHAALYDVNGSGYAGIEPASRSTSLFRGTLRLADGLELFAERALVHTWVDRVAGERTRQVVITPVASIVVEDEVAIVPGDRARIRVELEALCDDLEGRWSVDLPPGWSLEGTLPPVTAQKRGRRQPLDIGVRRASTARGGTAHVSFHGPKGSADRTLNVIDYPHILPQVWYTPADVRLVPLEIAVDVKTVGYIEGAGDDVPKALQRLGVAVERIDPATAAASDLEKCDAIVTGIRAYNTVPALAQFQGTLLSYVERGGTLLVQYNTSGNDLVMDAREIGPYPFALTRGRVTVEEAPVTFLAPAHPLMTTPNRLGQADFAGWIQERGLYFAGSLDAHYTALLAWNDPGEEPLLGALIACDFGKGRFVYTGISLFRQLPAGVPGAYRLLANLLSRRSARE